MIYDCLIIGAGPAGITAAINLKEKGLNVAILEFYMPGGKVNIAPRVDNYPGYKEILGPDLAMEFYQKMRNAKVEFIATKVNSVNKKDDLFYLDTTRGEYVSKLVIVASGTDEEKLHLDNEKELLGHGLSYCAICDGHFFKNKVVSVVAEDKYAIAEAIYLAPLAKEVIVITSKDELVGVRKLIEELKAFPNVRFIYNKKVVSLNNNPLSSITLDDGNIIELDGIFPLLGYIPNTSFLPSSILNEDRFVIVDKNFKTSIKGLFAIGDVIERELKQIYLAVIDANRASEYILNNYKG